MNKKKLILIICSITLVLAIGVAVILTVNHNRKVAEEAERLRIYNETYLVVDGVEYLRTSTELDLSGSQLTEVEKLQELTALQKLNLRGTGISVQQYDTLRSALPECEILWSVPFQGSFYDNTTQELVLESLSEEDLDALAYLPELSSINADLCRDYDVLLALIEQYPELAVAYTVPIGDQVIPHTEENITVSNPSVSELMTQLSFLPNIQMVTLEGTLPSNQELLTLKHQFPNITFHWNFTVYGVETNTLAGFLDLSGIQLSDTEELEAALPCFYGLSKVDMISCGLSNSAMEALNLRHPETSFVWKVKVSGVTVRTDIKYFMFHKFKIKKVGDLSNLRYCTDIEVLDFGHYGISDVSFVEYMPKLRYLLMLNTNLSDLTAIGNCTSLEFAELSTSPIVDFWPLTNLTNLKGLNLSHTPYYGPQKYGKFGDYTPLLQMTWLERLWLTNSRLGDEGRAIVSEALPNVEIAYVSISATDRGWRYAPGYYEMRDILGLGYMVH